MNVIPKISCYLEHSVVTLKLRKEYVNTVTYNIPVLLRIKYWTVWYIEYYSMSTYTGVTNCQKQSGFLAHPVYYRFQRSAGYNVKKVEDHRCEPVTQSVHLLIIRWVRQLTPKIFVCSFGCYPCRLAHYTSRQVLEYMVLLRTGKYYIFTIQIAKNTFYCLLPIQIPRDRSVDVQLVSDFHQDLILSLASFWTTWSSSSVSLSSFGGWSTTHKCTKSCSGRQIKYATIINANNEGFMQ